MPGRWPRTIRPSLRRRRLHLQPSRPCCPSCRLPRQPQRFRWQQAMRCHRHPRSPWSHPTNHCSYARASSAAAAAGPAGGAARTPGSACAAAATGRVATRRARCSARGRAAGAAASGRSRTPGRTARGTCCVGPGSCRGGSPARGRSRASQRHHCLHLLIRAERHEVGAGHRGRIRALRECSGSESDKGAGQRQRACNMSHCLFPCWQTGASHQLQERPFKSDVPLQESNKSYPFRAGRPAKGTIWLPSEAARVGQWIREPDAIKASLFRR